MLIVRLKVQVQWPSELVLDPHPFFAQCVFVCTTTNWLTLWKKSSSQCTMICSTSSSPSLPCLKNKVSEVKPRWKVIVSICCASGDSFRVAKLYHRHWKFGFYCKKVVEGWFKPLQIDRFCSLASLHAVHRMKLRRNRGLRSDLAERFVQKYSSSTDGIILSAHSYCG